MLEILVVPFTFLGIASLVAVPLAVLLGVPAIAWVSSRYLRLKERELDLRRLEIATRLKEGGMDLIPRWVDRQDPEQLLAWARADSEIRRLAAVNDMPRVS